MDVRLKYIWEDTDRHGNVRIYVAVPGRQKVRIRETPGTPEFLAAYEDAVEGVTAARRVHGRGTFGYVVKKYYASETFKRLDVASRDLKRLALDKVCEIHGDKPIGLMQAKHVIKLRDSATTKNTGNQRLQSLRGLFKWACSTGQAPYNPAAGVEEIEVTSKGHHTWTRAEIEQYESAHPIGTRPRLALDLLRYTACRREDVCRLGPQHMRDGRLVYTQAKNEHRNPVDMNIPIHPALQRSIEATPRDGLLFITTKRGKPFAPDYFNTAFRKWVALAGLPERCTPHGIRKFTSTDLAEKGASPHEIQSLTGHKTLAEVQVYTAAVDRSRTADSAMARLMNEPTPTPEFGGRKTPKNP